MRALVPDIRWKQLQSALKEKRPPSNDRYLMDVYTAIVNDTVDHPLRVALDTIETPYYRDRVAAFLLSGASNDHIARCLRMDPMAVQHIEYLMLDRGIFWHKLDVLRYAEEYENRICHKANKRFILAAIHGGPDVLEGFFLHGYDLLSVNPAKFANTVMSHAVYNIQRSRGHQLTADVTKEALKWVKTSSQAIASLGDAVNQRSATDLLVEIKKVQDSKGVDALGLNETVELLH